MALATATARSISPSPLKLIKCKNRGTLNKKAYDFISIAHISNWVIATDIIGVALKTSILNLD